MTPRSVPVSMNKNIGNDVWVWGRAIIPPTSKSIGDGALVAAGAVVSSDVPGGAIVAGNPARVIGAVPK